jgi:hypothetical protein
MGESKRRGKLIMNTTRVPVVSSCLNCGKEMDAATSYDHDHIPHEGAIAICMMCSHIMSYGPDLKLRELTNAEILDVAGAPEILNFINTLAETRNYYEQSTGKKWGIPGGLGVPIAKNEFKCTVCLEVFEKGISDEEAMEEKSILFNDVPIEECKLVCDDCFQKMDTYFGMEFSNKLKDQ